MIGVSASDVKGERRQTCERSPRWNLRFRYRVNVSTAITNGRFSASINGRFWMSTEGNEQPDPRHELSSVSEWTMIAA